MNLIFTSHTIITLCIYASRNISLIHNGVCSGQRARRVYQTRKSPPVSSRKCVPVRGLPGWAMARPDRIMASYFNQLLSEAQGEAVGCVRVKDSQDTVSRSQEAGKVTGSLHGTPSLLEKVMTDQLWLAIWHFVKNK